MAEEQVPTYQDLLWPTLKVLETLGGSATIQELSEQLAAEMQLSDSVLDIPHNNGSQSEVDYRAAWARTYLKWTGAVENSSRGVWTITETGRGIQTDETVRKKVQRKHAERAALRKDSRKPEAGKDADGEADESSWRDELLGILLELRPKAFERLCQRVLREVGFTKVKVTGKPGDGGIDGTGVLRFNLLSFHIRFQCKRYSGSVGAEKIRDFRGAMSAVVDKGLFITTGRFTKDAEKEAIREGATAIDLIDGANLCNLLKEFNLGVKTETVEVVKPQREFFENF